MTLESALIMDFNNLNDVFEGTQSEIVLQEWVLCCCLGIWG